MNARLAIRLARPLDEYPPLRLVPAEGEILPVIRAERCACGEYIRQHVGDDVRVVVMAHNRTIEHRLYRAGDASTTAAATVDVSGDRGSASGRSLPCRERAE